jgi:urocanate hydratase
MKTRKEQTTANPDVHYRQKRLGDGRIHAQENTQRDHYDHKRVARPFLEGEETNLISNQIADTPDVLVCQLRKTASVHDYSQKDSPQG